MISSRSRNVISVSIAQRFTRRSSSRMDCSSTVAGFLAGVNSSHVYAISETKDATMVDSHHGCHGENEAPFMHATPSPAIYATIAIPAHAMPHCSLVILHLRFHLADQCQSANVGHAVFAASSTKKTML